MAPNHGKNLDYVSFLLQRPVGKSAPTPSEPGLSSLLQQQLRKKSCLLPCQEQKEVGKNGQRERQSQFPNLGLDHDEHDLFLDMHCTNVH